MVTSFTSLLVVHHVWHIASRWLSIGYKVDHVAFFFTVAPLWLVHIECTMLFYCGATLVGTLHCVRKSGLWYREHHHDIAYNGITLVGTLLT